jgi:hypothetical protein
MGILWDDAKSRFLDSETGMVLSPHRVLAKLNQTIDSGYKKLQELADQVINGSLSLESFGDQVATVLRELHLAKALKAKNGLAPLSAENLEAISETLQDELISGVSSDLLGGDTRSYGLIHLIEDIANGNVSPAQLKHRLGMYGENSRKSEVATIHSDAMASGEVTECLNILNHVKTEHHPLCIEVSARGWVSLEEMKQLGLPARHPKCHCTLIYR